MRVFVYYNLHKDCWSIKALSGNQKGRVVARADGVELKTCTFKVSEAGRQRVVREKRHNVHVGVVGELVAFDGYQTKAGRDADQYMPTWLENIGPMVGEAMQVTYNPYLMRTFVLTGEHWDKTDLRCRAVSRADHVLLGYNRDVWAYGADITNDMPTHSKGRLPNGTDNES